MTSEHALAENIDIIRSCYRKRDHVVLEYQARPQNEPGVGAAIFSCDLAWFKAYGALFEQ